VGEEVVTMDPRSTERRQQVVILLGAPGAGKGTQAVRVADAEGLPHVSTGDLFRANLGQGTELGLRAKGFMEAGQLVPDDLVIEMLFDRVSQSDCERGYLLDGFPRTLPQAQALDARLDAEVDVRCVELVVPDDVIVERAAGRLICAGCGNIQHLTFSPPREAGKCDKCGGVLKQRDDDRPEVVRERLAVYHEQTAPLSEYYGRKGHLVQLDGNRAPDAVFESVRDALQGAAKQD
jgi:adenylate kinase